MPTPMRKIARFGLFEADLRQRILTREGLRVKLQDQPFEILALLLERPGEIVTREEIQQKLWPADTYVAFDDGLNTAVKKLRLALRDSADNPHFIETIPRRGYRFLAAPTFTEIPPTQDVSSASSDALSGSESAQNASSNLGQVAPQRLEVGQHPRALLWVATTAVAALAIVFFIWRQPHIARTATFFGAGPKTHPADGVRRSINPRAHDEYLQARSYWKQRTGEALTKAIDHYNSAIELDPDYAEAYAGLAHCYIVLPMLTVVPSDDAYPKARRAAEKAIALDDSVAAAHLAIAEIKLYSDWNFPAAEREFRRTLELDPNDAQAHQWYAEYLSLMGRQAEAIAEIHNAERLDPSSMIIHHQAGQIYQAARMYPEALLEYRRALMIQPGFGPTYSTIALAYRRQGRYAECLEAERQANLYWDPGGTAIRDLDRVADAYRKQGKMGFLRAALEVHKKHPGFAYYFAHDYALLGENDDALRWLQKALDTRQSVILNLRNDPEFDRLRSDPRFQEIAQKVGLPESTHATDKSLAQR